MVLLEGDTTQVIACGLTSNGFEIFNQRVTTIVQQTFVYEQLTIQVVDAIIGIPGSMAFTMQDFGLTKLQALLASTDLSGVGNTPGMTVFAADDAAFGKDNAQVGLSSPVSLFENHVGLIFVHITMGLICLHR